MNFRRSDFDVSNRINTTDPVCVKLEVVRIHKGLYQVDSPTVARAFDDLVRLYYGRYPGATSVLRGAVFGRITGMHAAGANALR